MNNSYNQPVIVDIHPQHLQLMRENLLYLLQKPNPVLMPSVSKILISSPFEISRYQDLIITILENPQLMNNQQYATIGKMLLYSECKFIFESNKGEFVLASFSPFAFKIYEILDGHKLNIGEIVSPLTPNTVARWSIHRLCEDYLEQEELIPENFRNFRIFMYEKLKNKQALKLHFYTSPARVTSEGTKKLVEKHRIFHNELDKRGDFRGLIDRA